MKKLFFSLIILFLAFFIACQENSITDPIADNELHTHSDFLQNTLYKDITYPNSIKLVGSLPDPSHPFNSSAEIGGILQYRIDEFQFDKRPPYAGIKVSIKVNAELKSDCPHATRSWIVNERAQTIFYNSPAVQIVNSFKKSFNVCNACCGKLNLVLTFSLNGKNLTLDAMRLENRREIKSTSVNFD